MNDDQISRKLTGYLDYGVAELRAGTVYKLQLARQQALEKLAEPARLTGLTLAGAGGARVRVSRTGSATGAPLWLGVIVIVAGFFFYQHWQSVQHVREIAETDAAILTSDLPIEAYLDQGFQSWLSHSEP